MRLVRVNYLDDVEHADHHLDGDLTHDLHHFGDTPHRMILEKLNRLIIDAPPGLDIAVAVPVKILTTDGSWHFGDNDFSKSKAGMWVMGNNHVQVWLHDMDKRPRYLLCSLFHEELARVCREEKVGDTLHHVLGRIAKTIATKKKKMEEEIKAAQEHLAVLQQDYQTLFSQYLCVRST